MPWPVNNWISAIVGGYCVGADFEYEITWRSDSVVSYSQMEELTDELQSEFLSVFTDFQHNLCTTNHVRVINRSLSRPPVERFPNYVGTFTTASTDVLPSAMAWGIFEVVGQSFDATTDAEVTNRPIQRGYVHLPGLSDDWIDGGHPSIPSGVVTFQSTLNFLATPINVTGNVLTPIIRGAALPTTPTRPTARPEVYAFVQEAIWRKNSWLESRET